MRWNPKPSASGTREPRTLFGVGTYDADCVAIRRVGKGDDYLHYYKRWHNMVRRCYHEGTVIRQPTYINCIVCDEWLLFSNFKKWMEKQDWKGKQLDKDLIKAGNKIYSPETCLFVPAYVNNLILSNILNRGVHPIGVCYDTWAKRFKASIKVRGASVHIGRFDSAREAHEAYRDAKRAEVRRVAYEVDDERLQDLLLTYADTRI